MIKKTVIAIAALTACASAAADPVSLWATVSAWAANHVLLTQVALLVVATAYTSSQARRAQRKAEAEAKARHNEALEDRAVTLLTSSPAMRAVYGRCIVGGDIVAVFTTDKHGHTSKGKAYTKVDGWKHVVIRIADHEVHAIHGAYWGGVKVGPLSGIGNPTYSPGNGGIPVGQTANTGWATSWTEERTAIIHGDTKLPYKVQSLVSAVDATGANRLSELTISSSNRRVTGPSVDVLLKYIAIRDDFVNPDSRIQEVTVSAEGTTSVTVPVGDVASRIITAHNWDTGTGAPVAATISPDGRTFNVTTPGLTGNITFTYTVMDQDSRLKFSFHTGSPDQVPDAYLMSILPEKWTAQHLLSGKAYAVVSFDLEDPRFQGGPSEISFDVSGRLLWDPRTDTTVYSQNNALVAFDYLTAPWGLHLPAPTEDVSVDYLVAAANVCDTSNTFTETDTKFNIVATTTEPLYTFNGLITSDESKEAVIAAIAQSMAGSIVDSSQWLIIAGAWTPKVLDLTDDDLNGSIEIVQGDNGGNDTFNSVRARYTPAGLTQPTDMTPYINSTLVNADGAELYDNQEYKYTDSNARCLNLARIHTELSRTGLVVKYPAKTSAWSLQIGDRVRVKSSPADFGFDYKHFRLTDWQHGLQAPVVLTLQEDEPETYDTADTALADPTRDIQMSSPWSIEEITGVTIASGTSYLVRNSSGSVMVRALVSWDEPLDPYVSNGRGRVEVWYRTYTSDGVPDSTWYESSPAVGVNSTFLDNLQDNQLIEVQLYAVNSMGMIGPSVFESHLVLGRAEPPSDVTGVTSSVNQGVLPWAWDYPTDPDYANTEVRDVDANWGSLSVPALWKGDANNWAESVTFAGTFTRYFRHVDTGGRVSVHTTTKSQVVSVGDLGPDASTYRLDISPVTGVLYTDYRGVVTNFSTANAVVRVLKSDGSDDTVHWTLSTTDSGINTTIDAAGALTVVSFPTSSIDENYYGSMIRVPMQSSLSDVTKWINPVTALGSASFHSTGGPFSGTGYLQVLGSGGSLSGLKIGANKYLMTGFSTNWSLSGWIQMTELPHVSGIFCLLGIGEVKTLSLLRGPADGSGNPTCYFSGRYFGLTTAGGSTSLASDSVAATSANIPVSTLSLDTWHYVEITWSATEKRLRIFLNGNVVANQLSSVDLASYVESTGGSDSISFYLHAGYSAGYVNANPSNTFRNGRMADLDYTSGGLVHTTNYTVPSALRGTRTFVPQAATQVQAVAGSSILSANYSVNTIVTAADTIQLVLSRTTGVVRSYWNATDYSFSEAALSVTVLMNGRNVTAEWDMFVSQSGATASVSFSASNSTKAISLSAFGTSDSAGLMIWLTHPNYPAQFYMYQISRVKDPKPAQTSSLSKSLIALAGDYNGLATDFSQATCQGTVLEGGSAATGWSWSASVTSGITYTHSAGLVTITTMDASVDQGSITLTATKSGWTTVVLRCEVVKSKLLRPSGAVIAAIGDIAVADSGVFSAEVDVTFTASGEIKTYTSSSGTLTPVGVWFNPATGTPGTGYRILFNGVWSPLSSDVTFAATAAGGGSHTTVEGPFIIAANGSLTVLGRGYIYMFASVESGG